MKKYMHMLLFALMTIVLTACGGEEVETNMDAPVADFEFTTQDGDTLSNDDLAGKWWIADFIFTNCETVCLPMTSNMAKLQTKLAEEDLDDVQLVSFSVEPDRDTPEVLTEYAEEYGADLSNWTFLTGYDFDTIKELSIHSFKNIVEAAPEGDDQITHGSYFFLVNPDGEVIKNYRGVETDEMDQIVKDVKNLQ